ncbi:MAG: hypothetical protein II460_11285, partial [Oscillospiraceae bacterium]|nr:hypothetical protein [Oscillospiraceae bacterium]
MTLMSTLVHGEARDPEEVIALIRLIAASTRLMMAQMKAGFALLGSFAALQERIPSTTEKMPNRRRTTPATTMIAAGISVSTSSTGICPEASRPPP